MGSAEKKLEESLLDVGNRIFNPPSSVGELLPLLDQAETFLSRVEQSPSESMLAALQSVMTGLTAKEFLAHTDIDVKVAVASCISEIIRITAPEAPYDDDLMKEFFQMIVEAFRKVDDVSSCSYSRRVSILETVAKVRSCVVMLDLECDSLILEMFHHFLNTIRDNHPENVFSSMETIMTLILEESEDISSDLLSCLLMSVRKNDKNVLPISRKLAEKVIGNCALKLKPCLMEAVQSIGAPLNYYSKVVASVCQDNSDVPECNGANDSGGCLADESKISERTLYSEMLQGSGKLEPEGGSPEVSAVADALPRPSLSNGTVQSGNETSLVEPTSALDHGTKKARGHRSHSASLPTETTDHSQVEAVKSHNKRKGRRREADNLQSEGASKKLEASGMKNNEKRSRCLDLLGKSTNNSVSVVSPTHSEKLSDLIRGKWGQSSESKVSVKKGRISKPDIGMKKQTGDISVLVRSRLKNSGEKGHLENVDGGGKPSTNSHSKMAINVKTNPEEKLHRRPGRKPLAVKVSEDEASGKHQASKTKRQKGRVFLENNVVGEPNLKGMVSSTKINMTTKAKKDQKLSEESLKIKSRKKRAREEISETPCDGIKYDENLVGIKIKVWWPDDEEFYPGVIDSYNPTTMRHKVLYVDGDEEDLLLKDEIFQFSKGEKEKGGKDSIPGSASETRRKKAKKLDYSVQKSKEVSSWKGAVSAGKVSGSRGESSRKRGVDSSEFAGGRRGGSFKTDDNTPGRSKSKEKTAKRFGVDTPKSGIVSKDDPNNRSKDGSSGAATKSRGNISKPKRQSTGETPRSGGRSKDDASKIEKEGVSGSRSKRNRKDLHRGGSGSKSDASGSTKTKTGTSRQEERVDIAAKVISSPRVSEESETRGGRKRRKMSQS